MVTGLYSPSSALYPMQHTLIPPALHSLQITRGGQPQSPVCLHPSASWQHSAQRGHFAGSQLQVPTCPVPPVLQQVRGQKL